MINGRVVTISAMCMAVIFGFLLLVMCTGCVSGRASGRVQGNRASAEATMIGNSAEASADVDSTSKVQGDSVEGVATQTGAANLNVSSDSANIAIICICISVTACVLFLCMKNVSYRREGITQLETSKNSRISGESVDTTGGLLARMLINRHGKHAQADEPESKH